MHQMQARLYARLQAECDAHIGQQLAALQAQTQLPPTAFLEQVSSMWEDYCSQMLLIRSIFLYLDRTYVMGLPGLRSLVDTGLVSLRQHLAAHPKVCGTGGGGVTPYVGCSTLDRQKRTTLPRWVMPLLLWRMCSRVTHTLDQCMWVLIGLCDL
jgi:hypothetical protein